MNTEQSLTHTEQNAILVQTISELLVALDRIAFRSNTLGQKKDIARKAIWSVPEHINELLKENNNDRSR